MEISGSLGIEDSEWWRSDGKHPVGAHDNRHAPRHVVGRDDGGQNGIPRAGPRVRLEACAGRSEARSADRVDFDTEA